jgi:hypothetical protein
MIYIFNQLMDDPIIIIFRLDVQMTVSYTPRKGLAYNNTKRGIIGYRTL